MADLEQHIRAALHHAATTGYGHMTNELERAMNAHRIVEERPHAWKWALVEAVLYALIFLAMGYFARPVIEGML